MPCKHSQPNAVFAHGYCTEEEGGCKYPDNCINYEETHMSCIYKAKHDNFCTRAVYCDAPDLCPNYTNGVSKHTHTTVSSSQSKRMCYITSPAHGHPKKIQTIKAIRDLTCWGLKETKERVEGTPFELDDTIFVNLLSHMRGNNYCIGYDLVLADDKMAKKTALANLRSAISEVKCSDIHLGGRLSIIANAIEKLL